MEDPLLAVVHRQQGTLSGGIGEIADDEAPAADDVLQLLAAERDAHVVEQRARSRLGDAQPLAHRAAGTVGGHEVPGVHDACLAAVTVPYLRVHPFGVLGEVDQLGAEADVAAEERAWRRRTGSRSF